MGYLDRIAIAPGKRGGRPVVRGLRIESVPKGAAQLFTLRPRKADVEPLFKRIPEHPPRA